MKCPKCGAPLVNNARCCGSCGYVIPSEPQTPEVDQRPENVLAGTIGALLGAILGGAVIILMSRLGYVASLSGLAVAISTLTGYEILGHRKPAKGLIICLLIMAVTPYIADRLNWAFIIMKAYESEGITLFQAFESVPMLVGAGIDSTEYTKNLLMIYAFAAVGAFGTVKDMFKKK